MRKEVINKLYTLMGGNKDIIVLSGDLGFGLFDEIRDTYPQRFINCGAAEQAMSDIAVGLALEGKTPVIYSITPFLLYRCFETWRTYVNHEKIKVILIGSGRDQDYEIDGFSHYAGDDYQLFRGGILDKIEASWPLTSKIAIEVLEKAIKNEYPTYINLRR
jgi:transketolase